MMKNKSYNTPITEEDFRKHLKGRALLMSSYILFGAVVLLWMNLGNENSVIYKEHIREFFKGFSGAIALVGAVKLIQIIHRIKNPEKFQKAYTEYIDERNRFVLMKTYYYSAYIFILLMGLAVIVTSFLGMPSVISNTLSISIGVFALILNVTYRIMNRIN